MIHIDGMKLCKKKLHYYNEDKRQCPDCAKISMAIWIANNKDRINESKKNWKIENKDKVRISSKKYYINNCGKQKEYSKLYSKNNEDKIKERRREYYYNNRDEILIRKRIYKKNNKEKIKKSRAEYYLLNKENIYQKQKEWVRLNPDSIKRKYDNRRKRIKSCSGSLSRGIRKKLYDLQKGKCACCDEPLGNDYHIDHIIPLCLGGDNCDSNFQLLKPRCNLKKGTQTHDEYMKYKKFIYGLNEQKEEI